MKIVIPGGTGQVGTILARAFHKDGHEVAVLSRRPATAPWRVVPWDGVTLGAWTSEVDGADVIINLVGRSVNCRYTPEKRKEIMESRTLSTRILGRAIAEAKRRPKVWLQSSTATIYAHRFDAPNDEFTGILGGEEPNLPETWRFSIDVAKSWEKVLDESVVPNTRKVKMRSAIIMSPDHGGAFDILLGLVRRGLGGTSGNGRQFVSWVHEEDFINAVNWLIAHPELEGAINIAAPNPLPNSAFMRELRRAWGIGIGLPAASWMLEIGAVFLGTETELILKSRRVVPGRLSQAGFNFKFPSWQEAARDLCQKWKKQKSTRKGRMITFQREFLV
ncbi:MAG TPA: TIGR01777 family oxidoreductase [Candidatus Saccharimonadales bacterium]|nr:TIGR01777 family oxidoreductase [Candidatus Saccharimonadales bacterium]